MGNLKNKISYYYKKYGFWNTIKKILKKVLLIERPGNREYRNYQTWINNNEPDLEGLEEQRNHKFKINPKISIVVPMYNTKEEFFKDIIDCMNQQTYTNWELCLADGSPETDEVLQQYIKGNDKIKYKFLNKNKGISDNTNEAIKMATGDYIGLLDHDDVLPIFCLYEIVNCINENPDVEFIYSDEDKIINTWTKKHRRDPHFKPDFSPDTLASNNYITHLVVMKRDLMVDKLKGERDEYNGAQDFDLVLRASEETDKIIHISKVLYHWRVHETSTAKVSDAKPWAYEAGMRATQDHLDRISKKNKSPKAIVSDPHDIPGVYEVEYKVEGNPKVNILIPNKDGINYLKKCVESILDVSTYKNYEIDIIENNSEEQETFDYYKELEKNEKIKILRYKEKGFNYSKIINFGVRNTKGDFVLQLNNDTECITPDWLEKFIGYAQRKEIGCVGARLLYDDKSIQHAGISYGICGLAANLLPGTPWGSHAYFGREALLQDISAVTGACLFCKRELYEEVGFMDEENFSVAFNDVDFCLKAREKGYLNIYNPYVILMHYESKTRGYDDERNNKNKERFERESNNFKTKWKKLLSKPDPYLNINFSRVTANYNIESGRIGETTYDQSKM